MRPRSFLLISIEQNSSPNFFYSTLHSNFIPIFCMITFNRTFSNSAHTSSLWNKFFARLKAMCCISVCSWGHSKNSLSLWNKAFLCPISFILHPAGFLSLALPIGSFSPSAQAVPSPASSCPLLSYSFSRRRLYFFHHSF